MTKELKDYLEMGIERIGSVKELAKVLGIAPNSLSDAKAQRHGIPAVACVKLAEIIGTEPLSVIAASELVTEKKEEKRAIWLPFVNDELWRKGRDSNPR